MRYGYRVGLWVLFMLAWGFAALVIYTWTAVLWCGGDGGSPYAAPASPRGEYCGAIDDGKALLVVAVVLFVALLAAGLSLARSHGRIVVALAALASALLLVPVYRVASLSPRCTPDDPAANGCAHY